MITHKLQQGTPEWHAFRAAHFSASDAPAMLGESPYKTRDQLLREKKLGITPDIDAATQRRYDDGHRFEALARPLAENIIGEELFPATLSEGKLSASFDGLTMLNDICFEQKTLNDAIAGCEGNLPIYYRIQMEQQMLVSGAKKCLFVASQWDEDNQLVGELYQTWYLPDPDLRRRIIDGWAQFERDLEAYQPKEAAVEAIGRAPEALPALHIEISGAVTASNLDAFKDRAFAVFRIIKTDLATDEDFADADKTAKWCKAVEERLDAAKQHALSQTASIDALFNAIDAIREEARQKRLTLEKLVKQRKEQLRTESVAAAQRELAKHAAELQAEILSVRLEIPAVDFGGVIKGLKTLSSIRDALDTALANAKIEANTRARDVREKLAWLSDHAAGRESLLPDLQQIIGKPMEDFCLTVNSRIERAEKEAAERAHTESVASAQRALAEQADEQAATVTQPKPAESAHAPSRRLSLAKICELLGMGVSHDLLMLLGFDAEKTRAGAMYDADDFIGICQALIDHIKNVADDWQAEEKAE